MNTLRTNFISNIASDAIKVCTATHLFPSLMIAQACLESNYGQSSLSRLHYNFFGIKASIGWKGAVVNYNTTEYVNKKAITVKQAFRKYTSIEDGFTNRIHFLQKNPRYAQNGVFNCNSPEEQAKCFFKAGYATDPLYAQKLIAIINQYNLKKYDSLCKTPSSSSTIISTTNPM